MVRGGVVVLAFALVLCVAGCASGSGAGPAATQAAVVPAEEPAPDTSGGDVTYRPAATDEFGSWSVVEMHGVSAEIPTGRPWSTQIVQDPCFGDERSYVLLQNLDTGGRLRIDLVARRVTVDAAEDDPVLAIRDRIVRSFEGAQRVPAVVQTFGPHPTEPSCAADSEGVPTLIPDDFTPPASRTVAPAAR